mmetsp:Transcript_16395/g.35654  ORF Transcript_16395/g.35654 Transcript_16395/m.35654 type:complete len:271 (-) Transcript_16395:413-1225(-)
MSTLSPLARRSARGASSDSCVSKTPCAHPPLAGPKRLYGLIRHQTSIGSACTSSSSWPCSSAPVWSRLGSPSTSTFGRFPIALIAAAGRAALAYSQKPAWSDLYTLGLMSMAEATSTSSFVSRCCSSVRCLSQIDNSLPIITALSSPLASAGWLDFATVAVPVAGPDFGGDVGSALRVPRYFMTTSLRSSSDQKGSSSPPSRVFKASAYAGRSTCRMLGDCKDPRRCARSASFRRQTSLQPASPTYAPRSFFSAVRSLHFCRLHAHSSLV